MVKAYYIEVEGNRYPLPLRTPKIAKKFDDYNVVVNNESDVKIHYKACELIKELIGVDAMQEIFGTSNKEEICTTDSVLLVRMIDDVYLAPITEYTREKEERELEASASINKLSEVARNLKVLEGLSK